jgi:hypothetical protein
MKYIVLGCSCRNMFAAYRIYWLISRTRERELGTGTGFVQVKVGRVAKIDSSWVEEMRRARRPAGARSVAAMGRTMDRRSTARRVKTSKVDGGRS